MPNDHRESTQPGASSGDRLALAAGADEYFAFPLAVTMNGAVSHLSSDRAVDVYIVDGGIQPLTRNKIERVIKAGRQNVRVCFLSPCLEGLGELPPGQIGPMTYLRLLLPALLPAEVDHVLYLDSDLLVRGDVGRLWSKVPLTAAIGASRDLGAPRVSSPRALRNWRELGLPADAPYINAGLLLMNLTRWRQENIAARVVEYNRRTADINWYADQDGINSLLCTDCELFPIEWNVPSFIESDTLIRNLDDPLSLTLIPDRRALLREASVVHYLGSRKPWRRGLGLRCQWPWLELARRSGWFESRWDYLKFIVPIAIDYVGRRIVRRVRDWSRV